MDIMISCITELGESVSFGLSDVDSIEEFQTSVYELYPCLSESYYENYRDFEADISKAAKESLSYLEHPEDISRADRVKAARDAINKVFGEISVSYEVDGEMTEDELGVDKKIFADLFVELLIDEVLNEMERLL